MARGDGIDRTSARNAKMTAAKVGNAQAHNERQKGSYVNRFYTECWGVLKSTLPTFFSL